MQVKYEHKDEALEPVEEYDRNQLLGSLIATGKGAPGGFNPKATARRRAKNRVARKSRRQNRSKK